VKEEDFMTSERLTEIKRSEALANNHQYIEENE
jgi:hypothetical protein